MKKVAILAALTALIILGAVSTYRFNGFPTAASARQSAAAHQKAEQIASAINEMENPPIEHRPEAQPAATQSAELQSPVDQPPVIQEQSDKQNPVDVPPEKKFISDGKHAIAQNEFTIYKHPVENEKEVVGNLQYGMLIEVLETRDKCFTVPVKEKKKTSINSDGSDNQQQVADDKTQQDQVTTEEPSEEDYEEEDPYAGQTLACYKIKKGDIEGWIIARGTLDYNVPVPSDDPQDLSWFFQKFGENTWYYEGTLNEASFTDEEYDRLIVAAKNGYEYDVPHVALRLTLLKQLENNPNDPRLEKFKDKVKFLQQTPN